MSIQDKFKSLLDMLIGPVDGAEGTDEPWDEMGKDFGNEVEYPVQNNTALKPEFKFNRKENMKVVPMQNRQAHDMIVFEPRAYNESITIAEALKERKTVILNLQLLDREQSQRIVDFLCGCTHALEGSQRKIGEFTFVFAPSNVNLSQETVNSKLTMDARWNQSQTL